MKNTIKLTSLALALILSLFCISCGKTEKPAENVGEILENEESYTRLGEGEKSFLFTVVDPEGEQQIFLVNTDAETVGEALVELELIEGEDGPYGMYVKKVCGIEADYEKHGKYWAFYISGEYATTGVDKTKIDTSAVVSYAFRAE